MTRSAEGTGALLEGFRYTTRIVQTSLWGVAAGLVLAGCGGAGVTPVTMADTKPPGHSPHATLHRRGGEIVDPEGRPVVLRGVGFGNEVWSNVPVPRDHHSEADFQRVAELGMNVVRFYLNDVTFEDDAAPFVYKDAGWAWVDDNVRWAKAHGVYLILNLHVPAGGFQSMGEGTALWTNSKNQDRLIALWRAIAARYRDEVTIAGYDLLNEPVPVTSRDQWKSLAGRILHAIRQVDIDHLIIVERTNAVGKDWSSDADQNFFLMEDDNVAYEFHVYAPFEYTYQYASWTGLGDGGTYPDATKLGSIDEIWLNLASFDAPSVPAGDSGWTWFEGTHIVAAADPRIAVGKVSLVGRSIGAGRVSYDGLVIKEFDEAGKLVKEVARIDPQRMDGFYFWSSNGSGKAEVVSGGPDGTPALSITGTTDDANLGGYGSYFRPQPGHAYSVSGYMRGERVPAGARAQLRIDLVGSKRPLAARDKAYLAANLDTYLAWGKRHDVPLYLGEFGLYKACFEGDKGGLRWASDMLDLLNERKLSFTYHVWHEDSFGIFRGNGAIASATPNEPLLKLFHDKLAR
jgi:endoglucanase